MRSLKLGSYSLHLVHTAFKRGIKQLCEGKIPELDMKGAKETNTKHKTFDLDDIFNDLHFFFKLSSARREDYAYRQSLVLWLSMQNNMQRQKRYPCKELLCVAWSNGKIWRSIF